MNEILKKIGAVTIVPVIKVRDIENAVPLAQALCRGGLPAAEITFRAAGAQEAIRRIRSAVPEMLVGAGTVLTTEQADRAIDAGAQFLVSPGLNPKVTRHVLEHGVTMLPGCATPAECECAMELGLDTVKFFPAEAAGGLPMIKAMSAPYGNLHFMPTGGIKPENLDSYLAFDKVLACGGTWMVKESLIEAHQFDRIEQLTREAVQTMLGLRVQHVGINCKNSGEASALGDALRALSLSKEEKLVSYFSGSLFELMKTPGRGTNGHVALGVSHLQRAVDYLQLRGVSFDDSSRQYAEDGSLRLIYLQEEFGGFALHLSQN
ncbi:MULTISPECIES: bifunctional 4-hydroxy-2-oxoglutarate aldolase/2-dehydro-3-deoxy-phosphogluconate aldolase [Caproicibacterium]|uniref:2-dehydro-3-deoxy-phosphogluconate aldolase n=1 Tax=Caproicibacterium argilliputei TaxID=3030016 RepID=A0AA97H2P5_9FIRM|nr:bifunctional 4-hydroxy-2-oxoglutarate aldolase/2-dehydro-3-deoxy-phosphogluconate aldolase [Caproicibacterium argilliputei]WOC31368.1 bifunctional 4-hydroxy-2-oxoglutarate aldolase/2-dehydro-3-deoxy-phosphogluconate aldolase [Caproicibacterium argilliputei]